MRAWTWASLAMVVLSGCGQAPAVTCKPVLPATATDVPFCVTTGDGWILQGLDHNPNGPGFVLLVHGMNEDHHSYDRLRDALGGRRVVLYDARGHGQSTLRTTGFRTSANELAESDIQGMPKDIDAVAERFGPPAAVVGASVGANAALLFGSGRNVSLVLLSAGLDYHGLRPEDADRSHMGAAFFMAATGDSYATDSSRRLYEEHAQPRTLSIRDGSAHGTNLLDDAGIRAVRDWLDGNATRD